MIRIGRFLVQTPLGAWQCLGTQPHEAPGDLWVNIDKNTVITISLVRLASWEWPKVGCRAAKKQLKKTCMVFFIQSCMVFYPAWCFPLTGLAGVLLKGQNLLSLTKVIRQWSLLCACFILKPLFHFEYYRNGLTETASDSLRTDITKKLISQELKYILPSCKKHWKAYLILP